MDFLDALGLNSSFFYQVGFFIVTMCVVYFLIIKPHFEEFMKREAHTEGDEQEAGNIKEEITGLESQYQRRQRDLNSDLKKIYAKSQQEIQGEKDKVLSNTKNKLHVQMDVAQQEIQKSITSLKQDLEAEVPHISNEIIKKVLH